MADAIVVRLRVVCLLFLLPSPPSAGELIDSHTCYLVDGTSAIIPSVSKGSLEVSGLTDTRTWEESYWIDAV